MTTTRVTETLNPRSMELDAMSALEIVRLMNEEDATVPAAISPALPELATAIESTVQRLRRGGRLIYVGAGTSGRIAVLDAVECVPTFSVPPGLVTAVMAGGEPALTRSIEHVEDDAEAGAAEMRRLDVGPNDVVAGVAASGRTPFVLGAMREAHGRGACTIGISNNKPAPLLGSADFPIAAVTGPEVLAGSTRLKAGTAQKLICNMLTTATMVLLGKVYGNRMVDVTIGNRKLRARAEGIVADLVGCSGDQAAHLLDAADEEVKTAVLMGLAGIEAAAARARLEAADGYLRRALG